MNKENNNITCYCEMVDDTGTSSVLNYECIKIIVVDEVCIPEIV